MEEKLTAILFQMNQMNQRFEHFEQKINQKFNDFEQKINKKFNDFEQKINQEFNDFEQKVEQKFNDFEQKINQKISDSEKRILDQQFLFENEYGIKIDAIFDAVTLELDKNLEKSQKIGKLEGRMDRNEVAVFNHERRISTLELSQ